MLSLWSKDGSFLSSFSEEEVEEMEAILQDVSREVPRRNK